jgi:hypothetical protein
LFLFCFHFASPSPPSSLILAHACTQVHRFSQRNPEDAAYSGTRQTMTTSVKLTYLSVHDRRDDVSDHSASPSPPSSLTHVHRYIVAHNGTRQTMTTSVKLTYLSVYDRIDGVSEHSASPSPPSSLTHVHRCISFRNTTRQTMTTSVKLTYLSMYVSRKLNPVYVRRVDSRILSGVVSLSDPSKSFG